MSDPVSDTPFWGHCTTTRFICPDRVGSVGRRLATKREVLRNNFRVLDDTTNRAEPEPTHLNAGANLSTSRWFLQEQSPESTRAAAPVALALEVLKTEHVKLHRLPFGSGFQQRFHYR